jgi:5-methylcytosine-specific restriction protein A
VDKKEYDKHRPEHHNMYNNTRYKRERIDFLKEHPLCECEECVGLGRLWPATIVDHKIAHKGDYDLFWDWSNWQSMAKQCHDKKTGREEAWGKARKKKQTCRNKT